ncbi:MAG TPA: alpha/beta hydrolase [Candidatus Saccharimonadales bacterium]
MRWAVPALLAVPVLDSAIGMLTMSHGRKLAIDVYGADSEGEYISIALPGFSNPPASFGLGAQRVLGGLGPMLVVRHCNKVVFDDIYQALLNELARLAVKGRRKIIVYGHSMGGLLGVLFRERYEQEGSPFGKIEILFLDCTPTGGRTLRTSVSPELIKLFLRLYRGGPIGALLVAMFNLMARQRMSLSLDETADKALYKRYARGLMWYNNCAVISQLRFILEFVLPEEPHHTATRVVYIGAEEPEIDMLVNQALAVEEWRRVFPHLEYRQNPCVGHAQIMQQPRGYRTMINEIVKEAA